MPTLRQVLDAATVAYYGGDRDRSTLWDRMPRIGGALSLVREGAGLNEADADIKGAITAIDGYIERLIRVRDALAKQWLSEDASAPATLPVQHNNDPGRIPPPSKRQLIE